MTPLWVISLFLSLTEVVLGITATQTTGAIQVALVAFVIAFPTAVAAGFFAILWSRPQVLYAPGDYGNVNPTDFIAALRDGQPPGQLFGRIEHTLEASISSNQMAAEVLTQLKIPRNTETERRVETVLGGVVDRAVKEIRETSFVEVDPRPLVGTSSSPWQLPYEDFRNVSDFLDRVWAGLRREVVVPPWTYESVWILRDADTKTELRDVGKAWAERQGLKNDWRFLADVGIRPGMRLQAIPVGRPHLPKA
jgi:hypothetical protein